MRKDFPKKEIVTLKLPPSLAREIREREILNFFADRALSKLEYYRSRLRYFETKYGKSLENFRQEVESAKEDFEKWDDLILWEGYQRAFEEWKEKYEELKSVLQDH
ncbi:MAG: hypothetical protein GXO20_00885 [Thermodesulfobacteria bacterium]|nr:hypothetical protein [Thermodesulfobacteriota bacterium]